MITFACVRTGSKYGPEYVTRLRNMIARHYDGDFDLICLTDHKNITALPDAIPVLADPALTAWWPKMELFSPERRSGTDHRVVYFDLDTAIVSSLTPLTEWNGDFGITANFTAAAGHPNWCKYGSCVMSFAPGWGQDVFNRFMADRENLMKNARWGDQSVIEALVPNATILQDVMPPGFFLNKRDLHKYPDAPPPEASVVVFGGKDRPDNCRVDWVRKAWR